MAYNNNNNRSGNNGYNNGNNNNNNGPQKKRSGAKRARSWVPTSGPNKGQNQYMTYGWRMAGRDLISVKCVTTSKSVQSDKGWIGSIACTFTNTKTGEQNFHWGTMQGNTGKVVVDSLAVVLNPAKNYCGTYIKSRN